MCDTKSLVPLTLIQKSSKVEASECCWNVHYRSLFWIVTVSQAMISFTNWSFGSKNEWKVLVKRHLHCIGGITGDGTFFIVLTVNDFTSCKYEPIFSHQFLNAAWNDSNALPWVALPTRRFIGCNKQKGPVNLFVTVYLLKLWLQYSSAEVSEKASSKYNPRKMQADTAQRCFV